MDELLQWAKVKGAGLAKVQQSPLHDRSLVAAVDVPENGVLMRLPQSLLFHGGLALKDRVYGEAFRALLDRHRPQHLDGRTLLCMYLLVERCKGTQSFWHPYIQMLPSEYDDPFWWLPEEVSLLQGTKLHLSVSLYSAGLKQLADLMGELQVVHQEISRSKHDDSHSTCSPLQDYQDGWALTLAAARWSRSCVWSRSFTVGRLHCPASDLHVLYPELFRDAVCLVPLVDMLDHNPAQEVLWHTGAEGDEDLQFISKTPCKKGDTLYNNYGHTKDNGQLLLTYGFVLPENPNDVVVMAPRMRLAEAVEELRQIVLSGGQEDVHDRLFEYHMKLLLLRDLELPSSFVLSLHEPLPSGLLELMVVGCLDGVMLAKVVRQWQRHRKNKEDANNSGLFAHCPLYHQLRVLSTLKGELHGMLDKMSSRAADGCTRSKTGHMDLEKMALDSQWVAPVEQSMNCPTYHAHMAVVYVQGQRRILLQALVAVQKLAVDLVNQVDGRTSRMVQAGRRWVWDLAECVSGASHAEVVEKILVGHDLPILPAWGEVSALQSYLEGTPVEVEVTGQLQELRKTQVEQRSEDLNVDKGVMEPPHLESLWRICQHAQLNCYEARLVATSRGRGKGPSGSRQEGSEATAALAGTREVPCRPLPVSEDCNQVFFLAPRDWSVPKLLGNFLLDISVDQKNRCVRVKAQATFSSLAVTHGNMLLTAGMDCGTIMTMWGSTMLKTLMTCGGLCSTEERERGGWCGPDPPAHYGKAEGGPSGPDAPAHDGKAEGGPSGPDALGLLQSHDLYMRARNPVGQLDNLPEGYDQRVSCQSKDMTLMDGQTCKRSDEEVLSCSAVTASSTHGVTPPGDTASTVEHTLEGSRPALYDEVTRIARLWQQLKDNQAPSKGGNNQNNNNNNNDNNKDKNVDDDGNDNRAADQDNQSKSSSHSDMNIHLPFTSLGHHQVRGCSLTEGRNTYRANTSPSPDNLLLLHSVHRLPTHYHLSLVPPSSDPDYVTKMDMLLALGLGYDHHLYADADEGELMSVLMAMAVIHNIDDVIHNQRLEDAHQLYKEVIRGACQVRTDVETIAEVQGQISAGYDKSGDGVDASPQGRSTVTAVTDGKCDGQVVALGAEGDAFAQWRSQVSLCQDLIKRLLACKAGRRCRRDLEKILRECHEQHVMSEALLARGQENPSLAEGGQHMQSAGNGSNQTCLLRKDGLGGMMLYSKCMGEVLDHWCGLVASWGSKNPCNQGKRKRSERVRH